MCHKVLWLKLYPDLIKNWYYIGRISIVKYTRIVETMSCKVSGLALLVSDPKQANKVLRKKLMQSKNLSSAKDANYANK